MAHFFGAVSEMRTSGLIPSWLGSSTSQPGGDREREKKKRHLRRGGLWSCSACCAHTQQVMYSGYDELTLSWLLHEIYPPCVPPDLENACLGAKAPREMPGGPSITVSLSLRSWFLQYVRNTYLRVRPHWQWGSWFASGWLEYQSRAP